MVVSSRQVVSAAPPVVVRVVIPRTGDTVPAVLSRGVTPPRTSRSMSLSVYAVPRPPSPRISAPLSGTPGSRPEAMTPARAAAANTPGSVFPPLSRASGPTSTIRSLFSAAAWVTSSAADSPSPPTTAIRSIRAAEASSTAVRSACCTVSSALSHTRIRASSPPRAAKASW